MSTSREHYLRSTQSNREITPKVMTEVGALREPQGSEPVMGQLCSLSQGGTGCLMNLWLCRPLVTLCPHTLSLHQALLGLTPCFSAGLGLPLNLPYRVFFSTSNLAFRAHGRSMLSPTEQAEWTQALWGAGNTFAVSLVPEQGCCCP